LQELALAERLFLPPPKESAESDKKAGVRVSRRILKQQQERIAAEKLEGMSVVVSRNDCKYMILICEYFSSRNCSQKATAKNSAEIDHDLGSLRSRAKATS
jgi:hypothetical protein